MPITNEKLYQMIESQLRGFGTKLQDHDSVITRLPLDLSQAFRENFKEHREACKAYQKFDKMDDGLHDTTQNVNIQAEQIKALVEKNRELKDELQNLRRSKISLNPKGQKAPWWAPSLVKVTIALVGALGATGLGAWGVHCSSAKTEGTDTARGAQPPVASNNK